MMHEHSPATTGVKKSFFSRKIKQKKIKPVNAFTLGKRQKFIISVIVLASGLFLAESASLIVKIPVYVSSGFGFYISFFMAALSSLLLYWGLRRDLKDNFSYQIFILPFLYTLSFGLFYFLEPSRVLTRLITTTLFSVGLYSLFLSENIFIVASIRTIALLNGARIVTFVVTLVSYFFLTSIIFSFKTNIFITIFLIFIFSFLFLIHAIWTYTLEKSIRGNIMWIIVLSFCFFELATILWFWPTSSTVTALFLTGMFYVLVGLTHVWLDRKLFKGVLWEYLWVACFAFFILNWFTQW